MTESPGAQQPASPETAQPHPYLEAALNVSSLASDETRQAAATTAATLLPHLEFSVDGAQAAGSENGEAPGAAAPKPAPSHAPALPAPAAAAPESSCPDALAAPPPAATLRSGQAPPQPLSAQRHSVIGQSVIGPAERLNANPNTSAGDARQQSQEGTAAVPSAHDRTSLPQDIFEESPDTAGAPVAREARFGVQLDLRVQTASAASPQSPRSLPHAQASAGKAETPATQTLTLSAVEDPGELAIGPGAHRESAGAPGSNPLWPSPSARQLSGKMQGQPDVGAASLKVLTPGGNTAPSRENQPPAEPVTLVMGARHLQEYVSGGAARPTDTEPSFHQAGNPGVSSPGNLSSHASADGVAAATPVAVPATTGAAGRVLAMPPSAAPDGALPLAAEEGAPGASRSLLVKLPMEADGEAVHLRFLQRGDQVNVRVASPSESLAQQIREHLPTLLTRLQHAGFRTEGIATLSPEEPSGASPSRPQSGNPDAQARDGQRYPDGQQQESRRDQDSQHEQTDFMQYTASRKRAGSAFAALVESPQPAALSPGLMQKPSTPMWRNGR